MMMTHAQTISAVRDALTAIFVDVDRWFDRPETLRRYRPLSKGWSINQVLEHITLTNHYLLLTLRKWTQIAQRRAARGDQSEEKESDLDRLHVIGERGSFGWVRPEHMEPTGVPTSEEVRATMTQQVGECLSILDQLGEGQGALCRIRMTVNDLGKIDLYQWLYFLAQHAHRHLQQMESIEWEYADHASGSLHLE